MSHFFDFDEKIISTEHLALEKCREVFNKIDKIAEYNSQKVLSAFIENGVGERHFFSTTGYGYGDAGRDMLDTVFAQCMGAQDALVRHNFVSGTHAITVALFGLLRPGDTLLCVTGTPYDTLHQVIGIKGCPDGSLKEFGVNYKQVDLTKEGHVDFDGILAALEDSSVKVVHVQRSRGYSSRPSLSVQQIAQIADLVHKKNPGAAVLVDNCYGEFVEKAEPVSCGADIMAGSLIKNPGGGIAKTGGYIAGRADLIEKCSYRLTAPGVGREVGATLNQNRDMFLGLFLAPETTSQALKTAVFAAAFFELLGFPVSPLYNEKRTDIIQSVCLGNEKALVTLCQGLQRGAPVDSFVSPQPWEMPGYTDKVIMAAGTFTAGSSIELSADAPIRKPYNAYLQGGITFHTGKTGILKAAQSLLEAGLL